MAGLAGFAVPVVPNASKVRGRLIRIRPEPDGWGATWEIVVDNVANVDELPNFAQAYVGEPIQVFVHPKLHSNLREMDMLEALVAFRGDEQGGRFVLIEDDVRKL